MKRKKIILSMLAIATVAGVAVYFLGTKSGKRELIRLRKTGEATAGVFNALGEEVARNVDQARKEERNKELKAVVRQALTADL